MKISSNICQNKQCLHSKVQYPDSLLQKAIFYGPIQIHTKHICVPSPQLNVFTQTVWRERAVIFTAKWLTLRRSQASSNRIHKTKEIKKKNTDYEIQTEAEIKNSLHLCGLFIPQSPAEHL